MSRLRIVIVDDHALFRAGVRGELGERVDVVGEAADVESGVAVIEEQRPDVVLIDVHLPGGGGAEVVRRAAGPRFLALSVSDAPADVIELIQAGARGYVTKTIAPAELADAIVRVHDGDAVFSPRLAGFVLDAFTQPPTDDPGIDALSPREREVLVRPPIVSRHATVDCPDVGARGLLDSRRPYRVSVHRARLAFRPRALEHSTFQRVPRCIVGRINRVDGAIRLSTPVAGTGACMADQASQDGSVPASNGAGDAPHAAGDRAQARTDRVALFSHLKAVNVSRANGRV